MVLIVAKIKAPIATTSNAMRTPIGALWNKSTIPVTVTAPPKKYRTIWIMPTISKNNLID
jgi:hypothetical protein